MRKIAFCFLMLISVSGSAQIINDSIVSFIAQWKAGEITRYTIAHTKYEVDKGDTIIVDDYTFDVKFEILEKNENNYKIRWTNSNFQKENDYGVLSKMDEIESTLSFEYETSELGAFKQILNFDEVKQSIDNALLVASLEYKDSRDPKVKQALAQLRSKYSSKEAMLSYAIDDILHYHWAYGAMLQTDTIYETSVKIPNIYGGEPFNAVSNVNVINKDVITQTVIAQTIITVDTNEATQAALNSVNRMAEATGRKPLSREEMPQVSIDRRYATSIYVKKGKMISGVAMRTIQVGDIQKSVEKSMIYLKQ